MVKRIPSSVIDDHLANLLEDFSLEDLLEMSNLSPEEALNHLYHSGKLALPDILRLEQLAVDVEDEDDGPIY